jgi:hypothetical protein
VPKVRLLGIVANKVPVSMNSHQSHHLLARRHHP